MSEKKTSIADDILNLYALCDTRRCKEFSQQFVNSKICREASERIKERSAKIKPALPENLQRELDQLETDNGVILLEEQNNYYRYGFENGIRFTTGVLGEQNTTNCSKTSFERYYDNLSNIKKNTNYFLRNLKLDPLIDVELTELLDQRLESGTIKFSPKYDEVNDELYKIREEVSKILQGDVSKFISNWEDIESQYAGVIMEDTYKVAFKDGVRSVFMFFASLMVDERATI